MSSSKSILVLLVLLSICVQSWAQARCSDPEGSSQAQRLAAQGKLTAAQKRLDRVLEACPEDYRALNNMGVVLEEQGRLEEALGYYRMALKAEEGFSHPWVGIGDINYKLKQWPLSLEAYLHACIEHPLARARVVELLRDERFRSVDPGEEFSGESLDLMHDQKRLAVMQRLAEDCGPRAMMKRTVIFRNFEFATGSADLPPGGWSQLQVVADSLRAHAASNIEISGHTDVQPFHNTTKKENRRLNRILSRQRAESIRVALADLGIAPERMQVVGYGSDRPLVQGDSPSAYARNRRVEIRVE